MARVPYLDADDLPEEYRYLLTENALGPLRIFRAFAANPPVLQSYMRWGTTLWREAGLDGRGVELVVLAVAAELGSAYEWHQHVPLGLDAGLAREEIRALRDGRFDRLDDPDASVAAYAVAVVRGEADEAAVESARAALDDAALVGVALLAGHYLMTARALSALGVEPEGEFVGWELENV